MPALVIVGGNEPQKTIEYSHEWRQQFKRGDFVILPNTHHNAGNENPIGWNAPCMASSNATDCDGDPASAA